jgi:hypothetical protein
LLLDGIDAGDVSWHARSLLLDGIDAGDIGMKS